MITLVASRLLLVWTEFCMVQPARVARLMSSLKHFEMRRRTRLCAVVVLVAAFSLAVNVATRYCSPAGSSSYAVRTAVKYVSADAHRQRLAKDAAIWITPVICSTLLHAPTSYPRIAAAGPLIPSLPFPEALYNRPPPSSSYPG